MAGPSEQEKLAALNLARQFRHFEYSIQLLERNFRELDFFLAKITHPPIALPILDASQRWRLHDAMLEVMFLLHNYVASAQSLVDHSRVLYQHIYEPRKLFPEYQDEIDARFKNDPLTQFVLKLRQMVQHYTLPNIRLTTSFRQGPSGGVMTIVLLLQLEDLRKFSGWSAPARKYLDTVDGTINIRELVKAYHKHVIEFYDWFRLEQARVLGPTFELASRLQAAAFEGGWSMEIEAIQGRLEALEAEGDAITPAAVRQVLLPALTLQEDRELGPFADELRTWAGGALMYIDARSESPTNLEGRIMELVQRIEGSQA